MRSLVVLFFLQWHYEGLHSARILGVFPHMGKTHFDVFEPLLLELAARGHDVHVLSFFPQKTPVANYTDHSLVGTVPLFISALNFQNMDSITGFDDFTFVVRMGLDSCEPVLASQSVTEVLNTDKEFDLLFFEIFNIDCFLGFAHRFKAPYIGMSSTGIMPSHNGRFGNPQNPSYVPNLEFPFSDRMTFLERLENTVSVLWFRYARLFYYDAIGEKIARKYFGEDMPSLEDIANKAQLFFVNTHYSLNRPRPLVPAIIPVGGLHIKPPKKLPQDIERFMNESKDGVVLFSMGTILLAKTFPQERREAFMNAFAELPQRFIMKWEGESFPNQPSNLKILKWLPQREILAHPNVVAFITHGGLLGLSEAVYFGVPVIGIPIFGDQPNNIAAIVSIGAGVKIKYSTITKESVSAALKAVIYDKRYKETATKLSSVYRDRETSPLETAVFWSEFVLRHNGTPFLQSIAVHQPWYQNLLLDVVATLVLALATLLWVVFFIAKKITVLLAKYLYNNNNSTKKLHKQ